MGAFNGDVLLFGKVSDSTGVIHVSVSDQYFFESHTIGGDGLLDAFEVATGVDNGAA